jgi:hypothetical protein
MAKHVANLGKGSTPPNHVGRETVPQDMGTNVARWWLQLGPLESVLQDRVDDLRVGKGHVRRAMRDEQSA